MLNVNGTVDELGLLLFLECVVGLKLFALREATVLVPIVLSARNDEPIRHLKKDWRRHVI